ncbi:MAG: periplasmic heavy metal sensor [Gemmataceae bacterium]|nr:periplasmic heavy metal sensor [Gemmataceae bacterium]
MEKFKSLATSRLAIFFGGAALTLLMAWPFVGSAQDKTDKAKDPDPHAKHKDAQPSGDKNLTSQIAELHAKMAKLEAALAKSQGAMGSMGGKKPAMAMMDDDMMMGNMGGMGAKKKAMGGMGMMDDDMMMGDAKGGMGMMDMDMMEMMGMMGMAPKSAGGMAGMKNMGKMQMKSALPSFPGASHLYHIGASDFFLNHPKHIDLTTKQKGALSRLKEKALLAKTSAQRKIDEAEQELWTLTAADEPDATKIEAKIQETEKLRSDQRMALIRAVGDAAKLLTEEQRGALLGTGADKTANPDPKTGHKTP